MKRSDVNKLRRRRKRKPKLPTPHDAFTKSVLSELPQARAFLQGYLSPEVVEIFDWDTLRLESGTFVRDDLKGEYTDLLFSIQLLGDRQRRRIRILFEHKRRPVSTVPRQLFRYISRQIERTPEEEPLPCIVTVVLLQSGHWDKPPRLSSEYDLPEQYRKVLLPYLLDFHIEIVPLSDFGENDLRGTEVGRFALALLKVVGEDEPTRWTEFRGILRDLCSHLPEKQAARELQRGLYYLLSVTEPGQEESVRQSLALAAEEFQPVKETAMTLLEHLEKRGERRGEKRGEKRGERRGEERGRLLERTELLVRMLKIAYPEFTESDAQLVAKLAVKSLAELTDAVALHRPWKEIRKLLQV